MTSSQEYIPLKEGRSKGIKNRSDRRKTKQSEIKKKIEKSQYDAFLDFLQLVKELGRVEGINKYLSQKGTFIYIFEDRLRHIEEAKEDKLTETERELAN